ncbi:MAG TPA: hypothetical protein VEA59_00100 [Patescibacteria group bacterium]|nr:hypothetical protein [Patescibacteria group bacterium]
MNISEAQAFVETNKFRVTDQNNYARCVDGRYMDEGMGAIAMPGADAELLVAAFATVQLLALPLSEEQVLQSVVKTVGGTRNFYFHTDDHAVSDAKEMGMGCGHIKNSIVACGDYGITEVQARYIKYALIKLSSEGARQVVLHGNHEETAVIIVDSYSWSVKPKQTLESNQVREAFVFHRTLSEKRSKELAGCLFAALGGSSTVSEGDVFLALINKMQKQLNETVSRLAKDLPVYHVQITEYGQVYMA